MKKQFLFLTFTILLSTFTIAQEINWISLEEAIALQKKNPKKIMVDVYTNWCGPCKLLDKKTFQNKDVANYVNKNFYAVKFNAEGNKTITYKDAVFKNPDYNPANANRRNSVHELARHFNVTAYPTIVFLDEKADFLTPIKGYQNPQQLELYLKLFKNDQHKTIKTQEDFSEYYKGFKPEFSE